MLKGTSSRQTSVRRERILVALADGPMSVRELADALNSDYALTSVWSDLHRLEKQGRVSRTPTAHPMRAAWSLSGVT